MDGGGPSLKAAVVEHPPPLVRGKILLQPVDALEEAAARIQPHAEAALEEALGVVALVVLAVLHRFSDEAGQVARRAE